MIFERIFLLLVIGYGCTVISAQKGPLINLGHQTGYYQGDIDLPPAKNRNAIFKTQRWPDGIVYYEHRVNWSPEQLTLIKEAMAAIERSTCIRFVPRTTQTNYAVITSNPSGCFSTGAGMQGAIQQINLQDDENGSCMTHKTIVHELLHAIGLWHEQSRYDRDDHITIHWDNLPNSTIIRWQFRKIPESESSTYGIPYNYLSVMHYDAFSAGTGGITMEPKDKAYMYEIGNQKYGHELDWEKVRRLYECKGTYTPAPTTLAPCVDEYGSCDAYLDKCGKEGWTIYSCRKSCGFCRGGSGTPVTKPGVQPTTPSPSQPGPCQDEISYCRDYINACGREGWMGRACRKTCKMC